MTSLRGIRPTVVGVEPGSLLGNAWDKSRGDLDAIRQADGVVVDDCEGEKLEYPRVGDVREINGRRAAVHRRHESRHHTTLLVCFSTYEWGRSLYQSEPGSRLLLPRANPPWRGPRGSLQRRSVGGCRNPGGHAPRRL